MDRRTVARTRIRSSRLSGQRFTAPDEAVAWHLAMQAQDYGPATWSIGQRSRGVRGIDVDRALADGSIVRTHVLRPTWHFVARDDLRWLMALSGPRVRRSVDRRSRDLGLDARSITRGERLIVSALSDGNRMTRNELAAMLDGARFDRGGQRMAFLLMHLELQAVICSGGLSGKQQTYALLDERVPAARSLDRADALVELTRRYLRSHGPATVKDMSWWSGITMGDLRTALADLGDEVRRRELDGLAFWSVEGGERPRPTRSAHLLQTYDELVVGYSESRFHGDPNAERARTAWSDRSLPSGGVVRDGRVVGHWRRSTERGGLRVRIHVYDRPDAALSAALEAAVERLAAFFEHRATLEVGSVRR